MERLIVLMAVAAVAMVAAAVLRRQASAPVPAADGYHVPVQLHRDDFDRADAEWLVVVFSSATCDTCPGVWDKARQLESTAVAVQEAEVSARRDLHDRYRIDGVPTTVVADHDGVVRASFLGPVTATDLWAAVAELREPGSVPERCRDHGSGPTDRPEA